MHLLSHVFAIKYLHALLLRLYSTVEDELVKVVRVGNISFELEEDIIDSRMDEEFTSQILSGVRFAPLLHHPPSSTILPAHVWDPTMQHFYPSEHQRASIELLLCSNSEVVQPLPPVQVQKSQINTAGMLPRGVWLNILSFTHRNCKQYRIVLSNETLLQDTHRFLQCIHQGLNQKKMK